MIELLCYYPHLWRREWDSNPRYDCSYTHFPSVRLKPLGHLSVIWIEISRRIYKGTRTFSYEYYRIVLNVCESFFYLTDGKRSQAGVNRLSSMIAHFVRSKLKKNLKIILNFWIKKYPWPIQSLRMFIKPKR